MRALADDLARGLSQTDCNEIRTLCRTESPQPVMLLLGRCVATVLSADTAGERERQALAASGRPSPGVGLGAIVALLGLIFYVAGVMATKLFSATFPEWFGSLGASLYTLFQIMTLESWSMGIVRPVMEVYPTAWLFFLPFILVTSFTVLNLFIGIVVDAMQSQHEEERAAELAAGAAQAERGESDRAAILAEIGTSRAEVAELKSTKDAPKP